jgi:hypothetical protein
MFQVECCGQNADSAGQGTAEASNCDLLPNGRHCKSQNLRGAVIGLLGRRALNRGAGAE